MGFRAGARPGHTSRLARAVPDDSCSGSGRHEQTEPRRPNENRSSKLELPSCLQGGWGECLVPAGRPAKTDKRRRPTRQRRNEKSALQESPTPKKPW